LRCISCCAAWPTTAAANSSEAPCPQPNCHAKCSPSRTHPLTTRSLSNRHSLFAPAAPRAPWLPHNRSWGCARALKHPTSTPAAAAALPRAPLPAPAANMPRHAPPPSHTQGGVPQGAVHVPQVRDGAGGWPPQRHGPAHLLPRLRHPLCHLWLPRQLYNVSGRVGGRVRVPGLER